MKVNLGCRSVNACRGSIPEAKDDANGVVSSQVRVRNCKNESEELVAE